MRLGILAACAGLISLTGCGTALKERAPTTGSLVERTLALQESLFAIIEDSGKIAEAATRIKRYCDKHRPAIQQLAVDAGAMGSDFATTSAFSHELAAGITDLATRSAEALQGKEAFLESPVVLGAIERCNLPSHQSEFDTNSHREIPPEDEGTDMGVREGVGGDGPQPEDSP